MRPQKLNDKGMCRVCHHRADKHYNEKKPYMGEFGFVVTPVPYCHHPVGGGVCGCVGVQSGGNYDKKRSKTRGS